MTKNLIKASTKFSAGEKLAKILISMPEKEKEVAFALIHGMEIGKQIAKQQNTN